MIVVEHVLRTDSCFEVVCSTFTCIPLPQEVNLFFVDACGKRRFLCKKKKESYGDYVA